MSLLDKFNSWSFRRKTQKMNAAIAADPQLVALRDEVIEEARALATTFNECRKTQPQLRMGLSGLTARIIAMGDTDERARDLVAMTVLTERGGKIGDTLGALRDDYRAARLKLAPAV